MPTQALLDLQIVARIGGADFVDRKIAHLKRAGLVQAGRSGVGRNGGACPDWLVTAQKEEDERLDKALDRARRARSTQPDIEWFVPAKAA